MRLLAVESSTVLASVAVFENDNMLSFASSAQQKSHSEFINPAIEKCLNTAGIDLEQIDVFACGLGPGSFTGVRVAGNIIKTFSFSFSKPMVAIDSLEILHYQNYKKLNFENLNKNPQIVLINAYRNQVYAAFYLDDLCVLNPCAMSLEKLEENIIEKFGLENEVAVCGDGYFVYEKEFSLKLRSRLKKNFESKDHPTAETLGRLAYQKAKINQTMDWKLYIPLYIRDSEAEEKKRIK